MERKYTESEIRQKWTEAIGCDAPEELDELMSALRSPRLKPDRPVLDAAGISWTSHVAAEELSSNPPFTPLIRADRVMEWAREWGVGKHRGSTVELHFQRHIREETEEEERKKWDVTKNPSHLINW